MIKNTFLLFVFSIFILSCSLFEDEEVPKLDSAEFYETGNTEFPVIAIDESETIFGFNSSVNKLYVKLPEGDEWIIELGSNNFPSSMYVEKGSQKLLLIFSDFVADIGNVAVINQQTQTTEYFYDIEFKGISNVLKSTSISAFGSMTSNDSNLEKSAAAWDIKKWWGDYGGVVKKTAGQVIGGIGCGASAIAAVGSGGAATPIAVLSCGSFASSLTGDIVGESSDAGGALFKGGAMVGKYGEAVLKCASMNWGQCALGVAGEIGAIKNLFDYAKSKSDVNEAKNIMAAYVQTGGLAGNWTSEEIANQTGTNKVEYEFGLNSGKLTQINKQSSGSDKFDTQIEIQFNYSIPEVGNLSMSFVRITLNSSVTTNGNTYPQTIGPLSWSEFMNQSQSQQFGYTSQNLNMTYELSDNGQTLKFSNGEVLKRK